MLRVYTDDCGICLATSWVRMCVSKVGFKAHTHTRPCVCVYTRNNRAKKKPISTKTQFFSRRTKNKKLSLYIYWKKFTDHSSLMVPRQIRVMYWRYLQHATVTRCLRLFLPEPKKKKNGYEQSPEGIFNMRPLSRAWVRCARTRSKFFERFCCLV